ncbi:hypothetical protein FOQG_17913 [Fusarium oxysporum f. sp. raphani 54005]|uniref:Uncharacterized protein n=2 Tax=Fusarium oxysporum TaxID=5507 RepID=X0C3M2_FUSOX|nr:hypothetical protein FOVG_18209 [Fusarium oxysporum f. sp. pisi HDV247]EXK77372.1 hypothetical protein FOQG_17913 [Fusarium oxysporum f. sp. raphani 54005]
MDFSTFLAILLSLMPIIGPSRAIRHHGNMPRHGEKYETVLTI